MLHAGNLLYRPRIFAGRLSDISIFGPSLAGRHPEYWTKVLYAGLLNCWAQMCVMPEWAARYSQVRTKKLGTLSPNLCDIQSLRALGWRCYL